jgi:hypothetical protein
MSCKESTHGIVGPSGATDPQARLRLLLQLGAEENARTTSMQSTIRKPRSLPESLGKKEEKLPRVGVGRARLVVGVSGQDDRIIKHCGSLPTEMMVRKGALEGLRYALLVHLIVFSDWLIDTGPLKEDELLARIPSAAVALELSLTPWSEGSGIGFDTFAEWSYDILRWFPSKSSKFDVVRRDVLLPSTAPPGCSLPEGFPATANVQWHVIDMDLNALEEWSKSIETKAKERFAWVFKTLVEGDRDEAIEMVDAAMHEAEW